MGCGKSTIGRGLSKMINLPFVDLDTYIEDRFKISISSLFNKYGESAFRKLERDMLIEVCNDMEHCIISTGGGTPCYMDNMDIMNSQGLTLFINLPVGMLANRVEMSKRKRPILEGKSGDELRAYIADMLEKRMEYYMQSKVIIESGGVTVKDVYNSLLENGYI